MDNAVYAKYIEAKKTGNMSLMKHLYKKHKNEVIIKFEYGKMLTKNILSMYPLFDKDYVDDEGMSLQRKNRTSFIDVFFMRKW